MDPASDADTYDTKLIDGDIVILFVGLKVIIRNVMSLTYATTSPDRWTLG